MESAMPIRKYGYKNIYTCRKCGGQTITLDINEGVTPFMIRCRATGQEGDCDGKAESSMYRVPADTPEPGWEWFKPEGSEYRKLSRAMRNLADKGWLDIRRIGGKQQDALLGYYRDARGILRKQ